MTILNGRGWDKERLGEILVKRFTVWANGVNADIWLDSGFAAFAPGAEEDGRARRPDVLLTRGADWAAVAELWPKAAVFEGAAETPEDLAGDYRCQAWRGYTVLTRLEGRLAGPEWDDYADEAKAVAGAVYRHLLEEVFRETREWCGHTFSVLGR